MAPFSKNVMDRFDWGEARLYPSPGYNRKLAAPTRAARQKKPLAAPAVFGGSRCSGFFVGSDIAVDEVGDVVVILLFLFQEWVVRRLFGVLLDIDVVDDRLGGLLLARLDFVERHDLHASRRRELGLLFLGFGGWPRARGRALKHGPAFRADDGILVEIKEFGAAILALALGSEFGFGHCDQFPVVEAGVQEGSG